MPTRALGFPKSDVFRREKANRIQGWRSAGLFEVQNILRLSQRHSETFPQLNWNRPAVKLVYSRFQAGWRMPTQSLHPRDGAGSGWRKPTVFVSHKARKDVTFTTTWVGSPGFTVFYGKTAPDFLEKLRAYQKQLRVVSPEWMSRIDFVAKDGSLCLHVFPVQDLWYSMTMRPNQHEW